VLAPAAAGLFGGLVTGLSSVALGGCLVLGDCEGGEASAGEELPEEPLLDVPPRDGVDVAFGDAEGAGDGLVASLGERPHLVPGGLSEKLRDGGPRVAATLLPWLGVDELTDLVEPHGGTFPAGPGIRWHGGSAAHDLFEDPQPTRAVHPAEFGPADAGAHQGAVDNALLISEDMPGRVDVGALVIDDCSRWPRFGKWELLGGGHSGLVERAPGRAWCAGPMSAPSASVLTTWQVGSWFVRVSSGEMLEMGEGRALP